jgi:hypothetical protein
MSGLYHQGLIQLQSMQHQLKATQSYLQVNADAAQEIQRRNVAVEQELKLAREAHELVIQQFVELQERHCELLNKYKSTEEIQEDLSKYVNDSNMFADEVARRAESLVNDLQAKLAGGEVAKLENSQSISGMILESAKNALLVRALSSQYSENPLTPLGYVTEQNVGLQQRNVDLSTQVETLSKQVEERANEVANLSKALELTAEDGPRKKSRRGNMRGGKK